MKVIGLILTLTLFYSCNDTLRTRAKKCIGADNRYIECSSASDAITSENFRKKYIAEVTVPVEVGQKQLILKEAAGDSDHDQELTCSLEISKDKQFNYAFTNNKLVLTDGLSTLTLIRSNGAYNESLIGSWTMTQEEGKVQTITELIFNDLEEVRIRKVCNLK